MTSLYTAKNAAQLRAKTGTKNEILAVELSGIDAAIDAAKIKIADLTASMVSSTSLAANGVDVASGTNATYYSVFVAPYPITIIGMMTYTTEAYVKETTDAKVELKDEAASPVTKVTYTFPVGGRLVKNMVTTNPVSASLAAGGALDMIITATASSTGTGHVKVSLLYTVD